MWTYPALACGHGPAESVQRDQMKDWEWAWQGSRSMVQGHDETCNHVQDLHYGQQTVSEQLSAGFRDGGSESLTRART